MQTQVTSSLPHARAAVLLEELTVRVRVPERAIYF
jgi:hypothetical protein